MKRRDFVLGMTASMLSASVAPGRLWNQNEAASGATNNEPTWQKLPRWRGFNLLEKFYRNDPFRERDFQWMADWGFDFVRLPLDYQQWTPKDNPQQLNEKTLADIDQAVEWGRKYGIHVCLNLHNAPGFTVNASVRHEKSLWDDPGMQQQFADQWKQFANRYRGEPSSRVSFNLVNEPHSVTAEQYMAAIEGAVDAIRAVDPNRLIISDGVGWGRTPTAELSSLQLAQSLRGYDPMWLTHFKAEWVAGSDGYPLPSWPTPQVVSYLYGPDHRDKQKPLVLQGSFQQPTQLRIRVGQVSRYAKLQIDADGKKIFEHTFQPGPGEGEWEREIYSQQWNIYQNIYNRDYRASIPAGTTRIELKLIEGDWLTIQEFGCQPSQEGSTEHTLALRGGDWGSVQEKPIQYDPSDSSSPFTTDGMFDREYLSQGLQPWRELAASGVGVHVGEWGAYRHTPHAVFLRWAEQLLELWSAAGFGWAMWNFRGSFGIIDSGRADVDYADYQGHQLDSQLLELLKRY